jgi:hypothetical protein
MFERRTFRELADTPLLELNEPCESTAHVFELGI